MTLEEGNGQLPLYSDGGGVLWTGYVIPHLFIHV
jgi:hypothetical protein